jgi:hypothetical protein
MATNFLWGTVPAVKNLLTTEMNALAVATLTALGPEIDNTLGPQLGQLYLNLASAAFVSGCFAEVFLVPSNDTAGGSYPTLGTYAQEALANYRVATMYIKGTTAAQKSIYPHVQIPSGKFKTFLATNGSCPTLGATGNTLDLYLTPTQF